MRDDVRIVIAISGRTGAGKSTVATALAAQLGWPHASFGDYMRAEAKRRSLGGEREDLQELGAGLIEELGIEELCRRTLAHRGLRDNSAPLVIEGVRHLEALMALRVIFQPTPVRLIHLEVSDEERAARLSAEGVSRERAAAWERHSTERDVADVLPSHADLIVPPDSTCEQAVASIVAYLGTA